MHRDFQDCIGVGGVLISVLENQMQKKLEKRVEHEMEAGVQRDRGLGV